MMPELSHYHCSLVYTLGVMASMTPRIRTGASYHFSEPLQAVQVRIFFMNIIKAESSISF